MKADVFTMIYFAVWLVVKIEKARPRLGFGQKYLPDFRRDVTSFYPRMNTEETILTMKVTKHAKKEITQAYVFDALVYD
jgi:hypothetical protein